MKFGLPYKNHSMKALMHKLTPTFVALISLAMVGQVAAQSGRERASSRTRPSAPPAPIWTVDDSHSSSLYAAPQTPLRPLASDGLRPNRLSPGIASVSLMAVHLPEPRKFALHDLVTIIVRESTDVGATSELGTEKTYDLKGSIDDFPSLQLKDLLQFQLRPSSASENPPRVGVSFEREFEGEGDYKRRDTFTSRITARIIDVKPNGTLVIEARKYIQNDDERLMMTLTGTCRKDDITADNTVLSSQLFGMRLVKQHTGELRKSTKKGVIPAVLDTIFNF